MNELTPTSVGIYPVPVENSKIRISNAVRINNNAIVLRMMESRSTN